MADVYLACTHGPSGFRKLLVVKLARFTGDPMFATMFLEEARIAAQLEHPNIVQTFEVAESGSRHYIVMEYLDGGNLAQLRHRARKAGGISLRTSLTILSQVLDGLEYAHEARALDGRDLKVIHRDLSPANIMVTAQGVVKILDFGIAKATDSYGFTHTGRFSGKLGYVPPEQLRGEPADTRDDLFAFGVILAEAALRGRLWGSAGDREIAARLGMGQIPTLDHARPIDPALRAICERALAPERGQRYARAGDLRADLAQYLAAIGGPISQRELAQFVCTNLRDDRAKLQVVIDTQLQKYGAETWDGIPTLPDLPRITRTPSRTEPTGRDDAVRDAPVEDRRPSPIAEVAPDDVVSAEVVPGEVAPDDVVPDEIAPVDIAPADIAPVDIAAVDVAAMTPSRRLGVRLLAFGATLLVTATVLVVMRGAPTPSTPSTPSTSVPSSAAPAATQPSAALVTPPAPARVKTAVAPARPTPGPETAALGTRNDADDPAFDVQRHERDTTSATGTSEAAGYRTLAPHLASARNTAVAPPALESSHRVKRPTQVSTKSAATPPRNRPSTETGPATVSSSSKLDTDISILPSSKRVLDVNVLDHETATTKLTIDQTPWAN